MSLARFHRFAAHARALAAARGRHAGRAARLRRAALVVLPLVVAACLLSVGAGVARADDTGSISGTVHPPACSGPWQSLAVSVSVWDQSGSWVAGSQTWPDGTYTVSDVPAGTYLLQFSGCGYEGTDWTKVPFGPQYYGGATTLAAATRVTVGPGQSVTGIDPVMVPMGTIGGTVTAQGGGPLSGVSVRAYSTGAEADTTTGPDGTYTVAVPAGSYTVWFYDSSGAYAEQWYQNEGAADTPDPVSVTAAQTTSGIDAVMVPAGGISGTITVPGDYATNDNLQVDVWRKDCGTWKEVGFGHCYKPGDYTLPGLPAGTYRVEFSDAAGACVTQWWNDAASSDTGSDVVVTGGQTTPGIDAALQDAPGSIGGSVRANCDGPLAGIDVTVYRRSCATWAQVGFATTAVDGSYTVGGLPAGAYRVEFSDPGLVYIAEYYNNAATIDTGQDVNVSNGQSTEADCVLLGHPAITSFSPGAGQVGTSVTISGARLQGASSVCFNGTPVTSFSDSGTQIVAGVPAGATSGPISVTTPGGTATSADDFEVSPPAISSFSPTTGQVGTSVTISGSCFDGATQVSFNGTPATSFTVGCGGSKIDTAVPAGATSGPITVTTPSGSATSADSFTVSPPTIASFDPADGAVGDTVTISGACFAGTVAVSFSGTPATSFTVGCNGGKITVTVPAGATSGPISVTTSGGTATSTSSFTVDNTPAGSDVTVTPGAGVQVTFSAVSTGGQTTVTASQTDPGAGATNFTVLGQTFYDLSTTASHCGQITVAVPYDPTGLTLSQQQALKLMHLSNGVWTDVTTSVDTTAHLVYGSVTSFSWFALAVDTTAPVTTCNYDGLWHTGPVPVSFSATDDRPGALTTQYSLDGGASWTTATSLTVSTPGVTTILYRSTDAAGNVEKAHSVAVKLLGVALCSGGNAAMSGSVTVTSPLIGGAPSAATYVNGTLSTSGSVSLTNTALYVAAKGAGLPPITQFMPDSLVATLTQAAQAAPRAGTVYNGLTYSGSQTVTVAAPITVNGNLTITGSGSYGFASVYVTGNVTISGSTRFSFGSLYVGGTLTVSGGTAANLGPTYVAGNTTVSGSGQWNAQLLVIGGNLALSGSQTIGGDGVGSDAKPVTVLLTGQGKSAASSGSGAFYGLLCDRSGTCAFSGSGVVRGALICGGSFSASGSSTITYDPNVIANLGMVKLS